MYGLDSLWQKIKPRNLYSDGYSNNARYKKGQSREQWEAEQAEAWESKHHDYLKREANDPFFRMPKGSRGTIITTGKGEERLDLTRDVINRLSKQGILSKKQLPIHEKVIIGNCEYCGTPLFYLEKNAVHESSNYTYDEGHYWCRYCYWNVPKKERWLKVTPINQKQKMRIYNYKRQDEGK